MTLDVSFLHFSYLLTLLALSIRGILWLRIILTVSQFGHLINAYMNDDINKGGWTIIFILINLVQIMIIFRERRELFIPEQIRDLYDNIFHTKTSREFLHFWDKGEIMHVDNKTLISRGDNQENLMLVLNGTAEVIRDDKKIATLERGQFIAEISYITGKPASADVLVLNDLTFYVWDKKSLNELRKKNSNIMQKLDHILTLDMAGKLIR
tara:strand:+ start:292 stop:921 length:630 start_codon:yes stop_codon:yes gene_type:complete